MLKNYAQLNDTEIALITQTGASPSENTWYVNKIPHVVGEKIMVVFHKDGPVDDHVAVGVPCEITTINTNHGTERNIRVKPVGLALVERDSPDFQLRGSDHLLLIKTNDPQPTIERDRSGDVMLAEAALLQAGIDPQERLPNALEIARDDTALFQELRVGQPSHIVVAESTIHGKGVPASLVVNSAIILPGDSVEVSENGDLWLEMIFDSFQQFEGKYFPMIRNPEVPADKQYTARVEPLQFFRLTETARNRRLMAKTVERVEANKGAQAYQSAAGLFRRDGDDGWNNEKQILEGGILFGGHDFSGISLEELRQFDQVSFRLMNIEHAADQEIELSIGRGEWTTHRILSVVHTPMTSDGSYVVSCADAQGHPFFVTPRHYMRPTAERRRARLLCLMDARLIDQTIGYSEIGEKEMREIVCDGQPLNQIRITVTRNPDAKALDPQEMLALDLYGIPHHHTEWVEWLNPVTCVWEFLQIDDIQHSEDGSGVVNVTLRTDHGAGVPMKLMRNARIRTSEARRDSIVKNFLAGGQIKNFCQAPSKLMMDPTGAWVERPMGRGPTRAHTSHAHLTALARATSGFGGALPPYSMEELKNATYQGSMALFWMCKDDVKAGDFQDAVKQFATGVETLVLGRPGRGFK